MDEEPTTRCALEPVDRRLEDAHQQWHQAQAAYFEPESFRLAIQSAIQTLRTVTFILQNRKHDIPDFAPWYEGWVEKMRGDPLMRWMIDARNKIEKQGDLEVNSFVRAEVIASYLDEGPRIDVPANLFDGIRVLLSGIPEGDLGEHIRKHGVLRVTRRWVENTLPEHELLDAVAVAYGRIAEVVHDAHRQMGLPTPVTSDVATGEEYRSSTRGGRMPCMIGHGDARSLEIGLWNGKPLDLEHGSLEFDEEAAELAAERFAVRPEDVFSKSAVGEQEVLRSLFNAARSVFLKDGYHETLVFLLSEAEPIRIISLRPEEQGQKYLMMRYVADEVTKLGADAVITLGEAWAAKFDRRRQYQRPAEAPDRREYLTGTLVMQDGSITEIVAEIIRDGKMLSLAETRDLPNPALFSFVPVLKAWGRDIPPEWTAHLGPQPSSDGSH